MLYFMLMLINRVTHDDRPDRPHDRPQTNRFLNLHLGRFPSTDTGITCLTHYCIQWELTLPFIMDNRPHRFALCVFERCALVPIMTWALSWPARRRELRSVFLLLTRSSHSARHRSGLLCMHMQHLVDLIHGVGDPPSHKSGPVLEVLSMHSVFMFSGMDARLVHCSPGLDRDRRERPQDRPS